MMESITLIFGSGRSTFSWLIRTFTWSTWSHVGVIVDDDLVIESLARKGVVHTRLSEFKRRYNGNYMIVHMPVQNKAEAHRLLRGELGKPYDFTALFGILFRRTWHDPDKWFCSELVAHVSGMFRKKLVKRITPESVWRVTFDK